MGNFTRLITLIFVLSVLMVTPTLGASAPVIYDIKSDYNAMTLTVIGQNLGSTPGTVTLGGTPLAVNSWSPSAIVAQIPQGTNPGSYSLVVTGPRRGDLSATAEVTIGELSIQGTYSFTGEAFCLVSTLGFNSNLTPVTGSYVYVSAFSIQGVATFNADLTGTRSGNSVTISYGPSASGAGSIAFNAPFTYTVGADGTVTTTQTGLLTGTILTGARAGQTFTEGPITVTGVISENRNGITLSTQQPEIETVTYYNNGSFLISEQRICHRSRVYIRLQ